MLLRMIWIIKQMLDPVNCRFWAEYWSISKITHNVVDKFQQNLLV